MPSTGLPCTSTPPPPNTSLSLLFPPFVFRGSCRNSADHQQLPFQRHLTLPNPRTSLHPDIANNTPTTNPLHPPTTAHTHANPSFHVTPRGLASQGPPPTPRSRHVHKVTSFSNSSASLPRLCCAARIVVPVCHHMANVYPRQKEQ